MSEPTSYTTLRNDIMDLAARLAKQRTEMLDTIKQINPIVSELVAAGDRLILKSLDEHPVNTRISEITVDGPSLGDIAATEKGGRKCSICGEAGHRKTTCPKAHVKFREDRKPPKPSRAPVTKGKRACSKCGKAGHRAPNCPN